MVSYFCSLLRIYIRFDCIYDIFFTLHHFVSFISYQILGRFHWWLVVLFLHFSLAQLLDFLIFSISNVNVKVRTFIICILSWIGFIYRFVPSNFTKAHSRPLARFSFFFIIYIKVFISFNDNYIKLHIRFLSVFAIRFPLSFYNFFRYILLSSSSLDSLPHCGLIFSFILFSISLHINRLFIQQLLTYFPYIIHFPHSISRLHFKYFLWLLFSLYSSSDTTDNTFIWEQHTHIIFLWENSYSLYLYFYFHFATK